MYKTITYENLETGKELAMCLSKTYMYNQEMQ